VTCGSTLPTRRPARRPAVVALRMSATAVGDGRVASLGGRHIRYRERSAIAASLPAGATCGRCRAAHQPGADGCLQLAITVGLAQRRCSMQWLGRGSRRPAGDSRWQPWWTFASAAMRGEVIGSRRKSREGKPADSTHSQSPAFAHGFPMNRAEHYLIRQSTERPTDDHLSIRLNRPDPQRISARRFTRKVGGARHVTALSIQTCSFNHIDHHKETIVNNEPAGPPRWPQPRQPLFGRAGRRIATAATAVGLMTGAFAGGFIVTLAAATATTPSASASAGGDSLDIRDVSLQRERHPRGG